MACSFEVVEEKLQETEFFLTLLRQSRSFTFDSRCYFSAFVSSARSVTFALQFSMKDVRGFEDWYARAQTQLRADALAPYFVETRNDVQKKGINPLDRISMSHLREHLCCQLTGSSSSHVLVLPHVTRDGTTVLTDVLEACTNYFGGLVSLVFDVYAEFKTVVDPRWYYTQANFEALGRTFEDALSEPGFPSTWSAAAPDGPEAWRVLRTQEPPCALNDMFERYLGKRIEDPDGVA